MITIILKSLASNWKLYLIGLLSVGIMKLTYDFGYDRSTTKHQKEIKILEQRESDRIRILNNTLANQIAVNDQLSRDKSKFEEVQKKKEKEFNRKLREFKDESKAKKENSDWLSTPIPADIIEFLQDN